MTDTNDELPEEVVIVDELRRSGFALTREEGDHKIGNLSRYLVVATREEDEAEFYALGDTRLNALKALRVQIRSSSR